MHSSKSKKSLGLYIHIPFCKQKCLYCDFCSIASPSDALVDGYFKNLIRSVDRGAAAAEGYEVDTIYIGGGTPTVLSADRIARIVETCTRKYNVAKDPEISCECNPATASKEYFDELLRAGVNRLSIGLQSANDDELRALGRIHSFDGFVSTYTDAREAGFDNISADLMYGIPGQTVKSFENTINALVALSPEHISAYCLKVEENTPFGRMAETLLLPDEDAQFEMYKLCVSRLADAGYERYEISNFAKKGRESRHNMRYWLGEDYLGFGAAAHSYFGGERFAFAPNISSFANGEFELSEREKIEAEEQMLEFVMLRMRLAKGIDFEEFKDRFGIGLLERFPDIRRFEATGHIRTDGGRCRFGNEGFFVSSYILSELLDF